MNNREVYNPLRNTGRRQQRNIEVSDRNFDDHRDRPQARGLQDEAHAADYDDYDMDNRGDYYPGNGSSAKTRSFGKLGTSLSRNATALIPARLQRLSRCTQRRQKSASFAA